VKVVIFCGGQGLRLKEYSDAVPKPMAPIGLRPVLWHVMRYYAHFGHSEFVLCLGYKAEVIKNYFLNYSEALSNDFILSDGARSVELLNSDIAQWRITFADTGPNTVIGQRLLAVQGYLDRADDVFLAAYGDCVTDAPLNQMVDDFRQRDVVAAFIRVRPSYTFHVVETEADGRVASIQPVRDADIWINGGYFILRREIFDHLHPGEDLVEGPFRRLAAEGRLISYRHDGFWMPMDTLKEMQELERLYQTGAPPWALWRGGDTSLSSRAAGR